MQQIQQPDEMSLKDIVLKLKAWGQFLVSKSVIIIIAGFIGATGGFFYSYFKKPIYTAEFTFFLEDEQSNNLGGYAGLAGQFGINLGGASSGAFGGENLFALMKSRFIIEKALLAPVNLDGRNQTLIEFYIQLKDMREKWKNEGSDYLNIRFKPGDDPGKLSLAQNALIKSFYSEIIANNLTIGMKDKKASVIYIQVKSENELFSKYLVESLAKQVSDFYKETKTKKAANNLSILQHQVDSVKRAFNLAISGVAASNEANPNPNPGRQSLAIPSQRRQIEAQINQAMLTQLIQNLEIAKMSLRTETPLIQIVDTPVLPLPREVPNTSSAMLLGAFLSMVLAMSVFVIKKCWEAMMA